MTVKLTLSIPYADLPAVTAGYQAMILTEGAMDTLTTRPVGTGPFRFVEYRPGDQLVVEKNPDYFKKDSGGKALPYMDGYTLIYVADPAARLAQVEGGKVDTHYQQSTPLTFDNADAFAEIKKTNRLELYEQTAEDSKVFQKAAEGVMAEWEPKTGKDIINKLKAMND